MTVPDPRWLPQLEIVTVNHHQNHAAHGRPYCHPEQGKDCYAETSRALALEHSSYSIPQKFMIGTEKP